MVKTREDVIEEVIENVKFDIDQLEGMLRCEIFLPKNNVTLASYCKF